MKLGRETGGNEASCRIQWKVHRLCLKIVLWLFPKLAFSLQLGHRFLEGRYCATDICMPSGTFMPSHRANVHVQTRWAEREGCSCRRKWNLPSSWRPCLGSRWVVLSKWHQSLMLGRCANCADDAAQSLGNNRREAKWWEAPNTPPSPQSRPCHVNPSEEPQGAAYSWISFLLIWWARTPGLINMRENGNLQSSFASMCSLPGSLPEERASSLRGACSTQHIFSCY